MEAYTGFAQLYDTFMDDVPYEEWCEYVCGILEEYGITDGLVLDLGCGTGKMTRLLRDRGYDMIGADVSEEMLEIAREAEQNSAANGEDLQSESEGGLQTFAEDSFADGENSPHGAEAVCQENEASESEGTIKPSILYLQQDMREFELYGTVRAVVCLCDSLNYILEPDELRHVFALVNNYLDPGGIFIFDMNTVYKYHEVMGDQTFCDNRDEACFTWENTFDEESFVNEYALNFFVKRKSGLYERFEEFHYQKAYEQAEVERLLAEAGLKLLAVYGEGTREKPESDCERMYFVAQEQGKEEE